ncbi:MAG: hypothetical protein BJ554DRAFT_105 [Olpidium bornovanus]|uniref:Uncharacterized protein n=1 Tax=Olpidium bornovanus TaxID=278681 RepID=A0A8H8DID6_9FUNG|nr:MAG: hypothetical protein BJ554DRAFT_105 [Olpidium bornovanus]
MANLFFRHNQFQLKVPSRELTSMRMPPGPLAECVVGTGVMNSVGHVHALQGVHSEGDAAIDRSVAFHLRQFPLPRLDTLALPEVPRASRRRGSECLGCKWCKSDWWKRLTEKRLTEKQETNDLVPEHTVTVNHICVNMCSFLFTSAFWVSQDLAAAIHNVDVVEKNNQIGLKLAECRAVGIPTVSLILSSRTAPVLLLLAVAPNDRPVSFPRGRRASRRQTHASTPRTAQLARSPPPAAPASPSTVPRCPAAVRPVEQRQQQQQPVGVGRI